MWFWIALMAFFLIVFLMTKAVLRSKRGDPPRGPSAGPRREPLG